MSSDQLIFFTAATVLIVMGLGSIAYSRNLIKTVIAFQVIVFGANLALFSSGLASSSLSFVSQTLVLFSILAGASVEAVALAIIVAIHKKYGTLNPWEIRKLKH